MTRHEILRILDANFNRSREGLRVCEEITRFVMEDPALTSQLKKARHEVSNCLKDFPVPIPELVAARDSRRDVGKRTSTTEKVRQNAKGLFLANIERSKESLRVLEEVSKLIDPATSDRLKKIRFKAYTLEKKILKKMETVRDHRS